MGGLQVDEKANLANWAVPGKPLLGVGGAMDFAACAKKLIIVMRTPIMMVLQKLFLHVRCL